jgi:phytoene dehydrogenase-like protein
MTDPPVSEDGVRLTPQQEYEKWKKEGGDQMTKGVALHRPDHVFDPLLGDPTQMMLIDSDDQQSNKEDKKDGEMVWVRCEPSEVDTNMAPDLAEQINQQSPEAPKSIDAPDMTEAEKCVKGVINEHFDADETNIQLNIDKKKEEN